MRSSLRLASLASVAACAAVLIAGCPAPEPTSAEIPGSLSLTPNVGTSGASSPIVINGTGFLVKPPGVEGGAIDTRHRAWLSTTELTGVEWQSTTSLHATVPAELPEGAYDLSVENALGNRGTAKGAYTVLPSASFSATLTPERPSVDTGQQFTVTLVLANNTQAEITRISLGALAITSADGASATIRSGPTPAAPATLAPGASATLTWTLVAGNAPGNLALTVTATGANAAGPITATPASPARVVVQRPAALVASWASPQATQTLGQPVSLSLVLTNAAGNATANVSRVDPTYAPAIPAGGCSIVTPAATPAVPVRIAGGASLTFTWTCTPPAIGDFALGATVVAADANTLAALTTTVAPLTVHITPKPVVSVTVGGNGTGTVDSAPAGITACSSAGGAACSHEFDLGTRVILTASPGAGATVTWDSGCIPSGNTCTVNTLGAGGAGVTATFTGPPVLTVTPTTANGSVTSLPSGIATCTSTGGICRASYSRGTTVTLTATAAAGYGASWGSGCTSSTATTCTVASLSTDRTVSVSFNPAPQPLTVTPPAGGTITCGGSSCPATFNTDSSATVAATPLPGYTFSGWTGGTCSGTSPCTFTMPAGGATVGATFTLIPYSFSAVVAPAGTGTVLCSGASCPGTYTTGTPVSVTASASAGAGYGFGSWTGAACFGQGATCTFTMPPNPVSVTANFNPQPQPLTVAPAAEGSFTCNGVTCPTLVNTGATATVVASASTTPRPGYAFGNWTAGPCNASKTTICSFTMPAGGATLAASFDPSVEVTTGGAGNGTVTSVPAGISCRAGTGTCSAAFISGSNVTLNVVPDQSFTPSWGGACAAAVGNTCTLTSVTTPVTATVNFR